MLRRFSRAVGLIVLACAGCSLHAVHEHKVELPSPNQPRAPKAGPIRVGDPVRVKSGGPLMTVRRLDPDRQRAQCEWFGGILAGPHRAWFDLHLLQRE